MRSKWLGCLLVLAACGDSAEEPGVGPGGGTVFVDSGAPVVVGTGGTTAGTIPLGGGTTAGIAPATTGGTTPAGTTAGTATPGGGAAAASDLPCDVQKLLKDKCGTCHGSPLAGAAPMPLLTSADFNANSKVMPGQKIAARVTARINDTKLPMPPAGRDQLTAAEKTALEAYIKAGAKPSTTACAPAPAGTGGTTGGVGVGANWQPPDSDCDVMMELRAHGGQNDGDTSPYMAPTGGDHYEIFWYRPTWNEKMHVIRIDPLIDNNAVLHHWLLYMKPSGTEAVGSHNMDSGAQSSNSALLSGWAPGNKNIPLGTEIGLQVVQGQGARFGIEIHYNTSGNPPTRADRSGAKLCLTKKLRKHEAATHWLGTQAIVPIGTQAVGTCTVPMESHIVAHSPHMHKTGKYMKTIVARKGGGNTTITDKPFDFNDQQIFPVNDPSGEIVVRQGDVITTTCDYTAPALFGTGTDAEMCYNFIIAWPVGSLKSTAIFTVGGDGTTCIDGI